MLQDVDLNIRVPRFGLLRHIFGDKKILKACAIPILSSRRSLGSILILLATSTMSSRDLSQVIPHSRDTHQHSRLHVGAHYIEIEQDLVPGIAFVDCHSTSAFYSGSLLIFDSGMGRYARRGSRNLGMGAI
jgi:hypothetical protein